MEKNITEEEQLLNGKVALVTGATGGIGRALTKSLVRYGVNVIGVARNPNKTEKLLGEIRETYPDAKINFVKCELSSVKEIKNCASKIKQKTSYLDILINNAGGYFTKRHITEDGYELTFALNYLCPFTLTNLLLPELKRSNNSRVINITSIEEKHGKLHFDDLQSEKFYFGLRAYAQSKVALIAFTRELAERLKGSTVKVSAIHPGIVKTNIAQNGLSLQSIAFRLLKHTIAISPEKAAENIIFTLTDKQFDMLTGIYIKKKKLAKPNPITNDQSTRRKLWNISVELAKLPETFKL